MHCPILHSYGKLFHEMLTTKDNLNHTDSAQDDQ